MKAIDKPSTLLLIRTCLGIFGFLVIFTGATITGNIYGDIDKVEATLESQGTQINEINATTREILIGMKWQNKHIEHIANDVGKLENK